MREISYIAERKWDFFQQPEKYCFCSGAKNECAELAEDGYRTIEWNSDVHGTDTEKIKLLHLAAGKSQIRKAELPPFVQSLKSLENIVLDISFLKNLEKDELPKSLRSITLTRNLRYPDILDELAENPVRWKKDIILENLSALKIIADDEKTGIIHSISKENFPVLKFLGFDVSEKAELSVFEKFSAISDIEILYLKDYDIFRRIEHLPLISLDLGGTNNKFDLSGIEKLKSLKFVRLNSVRSEIDCRIFKNLPDLKELIVLNSKKITNIEALLECSNLVSLDFLDCGNPFKKGIADKFDESAYEIFDIKYA